MNERYSIRPVPPADTAELARLLQIFAAYLDGLTDAPATALPRFPVRLIYAHPAPPPGRARGYAAMGGRAGVRDGQAFRETR